LIYIDFKIGIQLKIRTLSGVSWDGLECLGIPSDIPAVLFFHGSGTPPEVILDGEGFVLGDRAHPGSFAGPLLYGSVAAKASKFARPYLYLCMMLLEKPDGTTRTIFKPQNETEARANLEADVVLIGEHTETPQSQDQYVVEFARYVNCYFEPYQNILQFKHTLS
jgi:hypothetical protein